jgi:hypothetical protein
MKLTVAGTIYLDMLREWLKPQLQENIPDLIYQQDGDPPHFHNEVRMNDFIAWGMEVLWNGLRDCLIRH